jgi:hypothetical protein
MNLQRAMRKVDEYISLTCCLVLFVDEHLQAQPKAYRYR